MTERPTLLKCYGNVYQSHSTDDYAILMDALVRGDLLLARRWLVQEKPSAYVRQRTVRRQMSEWVSRFNARRQRVKS